MKSIDDWFADYAVCHQNPVNQKIHYVCVPAIFFASLGLLFSIPQVLIGGMSLNWSYPVVGCITGLYATLHFRYALFMLLFQVGSVWVFTVAANYGVSVWQISLMIFIVAWSGQFYGHKVEGKKPSFFEDLTYLFIGPLWVLAKMTSKQAENSTSP